MNWNIIEGNWKQFKGKARMFWAELADDDLDMIGGKRDVLAGKLQEKYGLTQEEAEKQIREFESRHD
jgi:uncharacterized protein YjbJ (UPF0337 family)